MVITKTMPNKIANGIGRPNAIGLIPPVADKIPANKPKLKYHQNALKATKNRGVWGCPPVSPVEN